MAVATDLKFAVRRLLAAPMFTVFSIGTLAIGIAVTTAMYSLMYSLEWTPQGIRAPGEIVSVSQVGQYGADFSGPEFKELLAKQTALRDLSGYAAFGSGLAGGNTRAELVNGEGVTGSYFTLLGVTPIAGRLIQPSDDRPDAAPVLVLSESTWRRRFNGDPAVVGTTVRLANRAFEVIGIVPESFRGASGIGRIPHAVWVPLWTAPSWYGADFRFDLNAPTYRQIAVIGRSSGLSVAAITSQFTPIVKQLDALGPLTQGGIVRPRQALAKPAFDDSRIRRGDGSIALLGLPALLLLIACTNLTNLALSRGASRRHEFAVRRALGASRWQVLSSQLVEGALVAVAGACAGALLSQQLLRVLVDLARDTLGSRESVDWIEPHLSLPVLVAVGCCALLAFLVSSLLPSMQLSRTSDRPTLSADTGAGASPRWRGRANTIALQVTASVCLFLLTSLGVRVIVNEDVVSIPRGTDRVAQIDIPLGGQQLAEAQSRQLLDRYVEAVRRHDGIENVAITSDLPLNVTTLDQPFIPNVRDGVRTHFHAVSPGAFRLSGVTMLSGRAIDEDDHVGQQRVIVLGASVAEELFKTRDVVGRDVLAQLLDWTTWKYVVRTFHVVGVCEDVDPTGRTSSSVYVPFAQEYLSGVSVLARGPRLDVNATATVLRTVLHDIDPDLVATYAGRANPELWLNGARVRFITAIAGTLSTLALVLSMAGLYGVLSHVVAKRTRELGLRMALGADRTRIAALVIKEGFRPIVEGLVMGLLVALIMRMLLQPIFKEPLAAFDPITLACAVVPLTIAGLIACYLPARRAARVEPSVALRDL